MKDEKRADIHHAAAREHFQAAAVHAIAADAYRNRAATAGSRSLSSKVQDNTLANGTGSIDAGANRRNFGFDISPSAIVLKDTLRMQYGGTETLAPEKLSSRSKIATERAVLASRRAELLSARTKRLQLFWERHLGEHGSHLGYWIPTCFVVASVGVFALARNHGWLSEFCKPVVLHFAGQSLNCQRWCLALILLGPAFFYPCVYYGALKRSSDKEYVKSMCEMWTPLWAIIAGFCVALYLK